jgi:predicted RNA binding protein YcfA (HicA-like mRNA interferase family)
MSRKDKLLLRFLSRPRDFTFDETVKLLSEFGFREVRTGTTSGSRVRFKNDDYPLNILKFHKPHPGNILKTYVLDMIIENLEDCNLLTDKKEKDNEQDFEV